MIYDHLEFGRRLFAGRDLYAPYLDDGPLHPVYPPSFGLMTGPFALFPDPVARALWGLVQVAALFWIGLWMTRLLRAHWPSLSKHTHTILLLTAVLGSRYILRDTHGGGGNLINTALVIGAFHLAERQKDLLAGVLLGLSLATKPTMVLFVPLLVAFGFRKAAVSAAGFAAGLLGLSLAVHGQGFAPLLRWIEGSMAYGDMPDVFETPDAGFPPFTWMNQCLRCAVARFGGTVPESFAEQVPGFFQGMGLSTTTLVLVRRMLSMAVLTAAFWTAWRQKDHKLGRAIALATMFAASLLLSPISWKAHHVALIPLLFLLVSHAMRGRWIGWLGAGCYLLACVLGEQIVGKDFKNVQQSLYLTTAGTIALFAMGLRSRIRTTGNDVPQGSTLTDA